MPREDWPRRFAFLMQINAKLPAEQSCEAGAVIHLAPPKP